MTGKRTFTTVLGCVACDDLSEFGAGKEGWLAKPEGVLCALDDISLALANSKLIVITGWNNGPRTKIRPDFLPMDSEFITSLEWVVSHEFRAIAVGTSCGYLLLYSLEGHLIHRQLIYPRRVVKIRARGVQMNINQHRALDVHEISIIMPGIIARLDGSQVKSLLQDWFQEMHGQLRDETSPSKGNLASCHNSGKKLPCQLWNVDKYGQCTDAAIIAIMPPALLEVQSSQRYYSAVTIGEDAVVSSYRLSEERSGSFVGAILSKVVPATFSTIASVSRIVWRREQKTRKLDSKPPSFSKSVPLTCLKDNPRKGERLTISPAGTLAAITDSLGRILLFDTHALVVLRLWKGYRDACCLFMDMLANKEHTRETASRFIPPKSDYCLCLAIHAPRKGIIEVVYIMPSSGHSG